MDYPKKNSEQIPNIQYPMNLPQANAGVNHTIQQVND